MAVTYGLATVLYGPVGIDAFVFAAIGVTASITFMVAVVLAASVVVANQAAVAAIGFVVFFLPQLLGEPVAGRHLAVPAVVDPELGDGPGHRGRDGDRDPDRMGGLGRRPGGLRHLADGPPGVLVAGLTAPAQASAPDRTSRSGAFVSPRRSSVDRLEEVLGDGQWPTGWK